MAQLQIGMKKPYLSQYETYTTTKCYIHAHLNLVYVLIVILIYNMISTAIEIMPIHVLYTA